MYEYSVRIDDLNNGQDKTRVIAFILGVIPESYIITCETASETKKLHYHAYVKTRDYPMKKLRNKFNYLFSATHKRHTYALANVKNSANFLSYIIKDGDIVMTSYSAEELTKIKAWIPKDEYKSKSSVLTKLKQAITEKELSSIIDNMMIFYDKNNMPFDKWRMKNYAYAIYYHNNDKNDNVKQEIREFLLN